MIGAAENSNTFRAHFRGLVQDTIAKADALGRHGHAGLKGLLREVFVADLLKKVLSPGVAWGNGQLTCIDGEISPQIDVVLYAPSILPPAVSNDSVHGFFPIESCLYTIEIKTKLTREELRKSIESARKVRSLKPLTTEHWTPFVPAGQVVLSQQAYMPHPISALFAYSTNLARGSDKELQRYRELDLEADTNPAISVICIRGAGYWFFDKNVWKFLPANEDFDEIMYFLAGVANTMPQLMVAKGNPRFGHYLIKQGNNLRTV